MHQKYISDAITLSLKKKVGENIIAYDLKSGGNHKKSTYT